ncbi:MAG: L-seryl-tRNA(Sec) selenium transferase [Bryobacteraceae bacterium]
MTSAEQERLRALPSVDELASAMQGRFPEAPWRVVVEEARRVLDHARSEIRAGRGSAEPAIEQRLASALHALLTPSLQGVINATGVVLNTNLGRAPLPRFEPPAGYSNLEYDLASGRRGKRDTHIAGLLERLLGAPAIAVNNNAAAVWLALNELAAGYEVIVSRGELIEIGDGFRIPDIMRLSGAILREVGTTNRTRIEDYRDAVNERTRLLLRVHPSNFRIEGFSGRPELEEFAALGRERGIPVYEDLGSGCLVDMRPYGVEEPLASESLRAGVNLISFSGDKLLGGPQAGVLAGDPALVARLRRNPMFRALRLDKLISQALETTLRHLLLEQWDRIPALGMIAMPAESIRERAQRFLAELSGLRGSLEPGRSLIGGGSTPAQSLPTWLLVIESDDVTKLERRLRAGEPPVIGRIEDDRLLLDLRTVLPEQEPALRSALQARSW